MHSIVRDATGQALAYIYFEDEPQRQMAMKRLSRDEAFLIAANIAKLPHVPRQVLKDIPRPHMRALFRPFENRGVHFFIWGCPLSNSYVGIDSIDLGNGARGPDFAE